MKKLGFGLVAIVMLLLVVLTPATTIAQGPVGPQGVATWTGEYFNNIALTGSPVLVRDDANIDFFWPEGTSPAPGSVNVNNYSVRWTRSINFTSAGNWTFNFVADDGVRLWVDNNSVIDAWVDEPPTPHTGTIVLVAGWHTVRVEYYNRTLAGTAKLTYWPDVPYSDWKGEYFANQTLAGAPMFIRNDPNIIFNWGDGSPGVGIPADHFSVRWTRTMQFNAGRWRFSATTDDGVRVWVDSTLLIDEWIDEVPTTHTAEIDLTQGQHLVKMEYYENTGGAMASLAFVPVTPSSTVWHGEYFDNMSLSGTAKFIRDDPDIDFDWGVGSPDTTIPVDHFSVRWTRTVQVNAGRWRFAMTTDDGVRVWVDNTLLIDKWIDQPPTTNAAETDLTQGQHLLKIEYYENTGGAMARLAFVQVTPSSGVWHGEYFNNISLSGAPSLVRDDPDINFQWGTGSPGAAIPPDNFSVRWTTKRQSPGGYYVLSITSDDGARVWVDGVLLINAWYDRAPTTSSAARSLGAGEHDIRVEYYEHTGNASVVLNIETGVSPPAGEVVVDDRGVGWTMGGPSAYWHNALGGIGGQSLWTFNNSSSIPDYNWGRWAPTLPHAGNYEVSAYIPGGLGTTLNARYSIFHDQRYDLAMRSQALYADQWMSLGTYYFAALGAENVFLSDITYECYLCRKIVFDAVKFSPR